MTSRLESNRFCTTLNLAKGESIKVPPLYLPFQPSTSPHGEQVQRETLLWARRLRLLGDENDPLHACLSQVGWLCARTYPKASLQVLRLVSDWTTLFFLMDDLAESPAHTPSTLDQRNQAALNALAGTERDILNNDSINLALRDLGARFREISSPGWLSRFVLHVRKWLESHIWEAKNRATRRVPPLEEYVQMRQYSIGMYFQFLLSEITDEYELRPELLNHPLTEQLAQAANRQIAWANDILTINKELRQGDVHNLVLSIRDQRGVDLKEAVDQAVEIHNNEVTSFMETAIKMLLSSMNDVAASRYIMALQNWMSGHLHWGFESDRYRAADAI